MSSNIVKIRLLKDDYRLKHCENNSALCIYTDEVKNTGIDIIEYIGSTRSKQLKANKFLASKKIGKMLYTGNKNTITQYIGSYDQALLDTNPNNYTITTSSIEPKKLIINLSKSGMYKIEVKKYVNGNLDLRLSEYERSHRFHMECVVYRRYQGYSKFDLVLV